MRRGAKWEADGVRIVRAGSVGAALRQPSANGRATVFEFTGAGGRETWIGVVTLQPNARTAMHHHGRHEVALFVVKGRGRIRWGEQLEFASEVGPGDFVYFAPHVPHQEANPDERETAEFVVVRSDSEPIAVKLDAIPVEHPETVRWPS